MRTSRWEGAVDWEGGKRRREETQKTMRGGMGRKRGCRSEMRRTSIKFSGSK